MPEVTRKKLPETRKSLTHKFRIGEHKGYITVGLFEDGTVGEVFMKMAKTGSTISGLLDALSICTSMSLQYGVPLSALCEKFKHTRFEPDGYSGSEFKFATSIIDYVFRWLEARYVNQTGWTGPAIEEALSSHSAVSSSSSD